MYVPMPPKRNARARLLDMTTTEILDMLINRAQGNPEVLGNLRAVQEVHVAEEEARRLAESNLLVRLSEMMTEEMTALVSNVREHERRCFISILRHGRE